MSSADGLRVLEGQGDPLIGRTIDGRYLVERVLGEGGMGLVYKGKHTTLGKDLAIKVLRPDVSKDEEIITRFQQEAQSASSIGNEHIIDISDFGTLPNGSTYFVMEFLDGQDLTSLIENDRPIPTLRAIHVARQICRALGAAHQRGIVHRDLKPDNIYLIRRGEDVDFVKVLDFGIAKVGGNASKLTKAGQVFGTPHYMSPEQCAGSDVDQRTDIYALGVILYEMVTGEVPFDADNLMGILTKHLYEQPVAPRSLPSGAEVAPELEAVIMKCLDKDADRRYPSMPDMLADLERIEQGLAPEAVSERQAMEALAPPDLDLTPTAGIGGSGKWIAFGALALALIIGGGATAYFLLKPPAPTPVTRVTPDSNTTMTTMNPSAMDTSMNEPPPRMVEPVNMVEPTAMTAPAIDPPGVTLSPIITVRSQPEGAEVFVDGNLVGRTPQALNRPEGSDRVTAVIRKDGYHEQQIALMSVSPDSLDVELARRRRRGSSASRVEMTPEAAVMVTPMMTVMMDPPPPQPVMMNMGGGATPSGELVNPWDD